MKNIFKTPRVIKAGNLFKRRWRTVTLAVAGLALLGVASVTEIAKSQINRDIAATDTITSAGATSNQKFNAVKTLFASNNDKSREVSLDYWRAYVNAPTQETVRRLKSSQ